MSKSARFGPVQAEFREDGSLFIYQPNPDVVLGATRARDLTEWLSLYVGAKLPPLLVKAPDHPPYEDVHKTQSTVPAGVINTSAGPTSAPPDGSPISSSWDPEDRATLAEMTATAEADGTAELATEFVDTRPSLDANPRIQDLRAAAKALGVSAKGSKAEILARMKDKGITGPGLDDE